MDTLGGKLKDVSGSYNTDIKSIDLKYDNKIELYAESNNGMPDFQARINSIKETNVKSASPADLNAPRLIDISGHQGMIWTNSSIYWWDSGIEYRLYGPFGSDQTALRVADSCY